MTNWRIAAGRGISPDDEARRGAGRRPRTDRVIASCSAQSQNPIGALIQVKSVPLRVIGVLASKGQTPFGQDQDDLVMIPFTTAERKVLGVAAPSQQQTQLNWIYPTPPNPYGLTAAPDRLRQSDLRAGRQSGGRAAGDPRRSPRFSRAAIASGPATSTISPCAISARSPKRPRAAAASWRSCSPRSPRSRWWSAASAS